MISGVAPRTDGSGEDRVVIIHLGQGTSHNGNYTITTAAASGIATFSNTGLLFQADARAINAQADALGTVTFTGNDVSGSVDNPEQGVTYVLRTYLSQEKGGTDYLVDEQVLVDTADFHLTVPSSGTAAPSGNYYVSTFLMRQETGDFDDDGTAEADEIALLGIGNSSSQHMVAYTNTMQPGQVQNVTLTATGNEAMQATWQEVSDADGYQITIYHADGTDTGLGYEYDVSQFSGQSQMPGLNLKNGTFSLSGTLTSGDTMSRIVSVTDQVGNETTIPAMITLLKEYAVHFDANGGSGTMPDDTASIGTNYTLPVCTFTPPQGKQFKTWSIDPDSTTEYAPGDSVVLDEDTTFYALWEDAPHTHSGVLHTGYAATCDAPGEKDYCTCSCNKFFEDAACTKEITDLETWKVIPATGHKLTQTGAVAPTCTQEGYTGDEVCTVCQKVITPGKALEKLPHNYKDGKCTMCGASSPTTTPTIGNGANRIWVKGSKDGLSVTSSAAFGDFVKVQVDGNDLAASHYTVQGDSTTVVTLKASYLKTLSVGKHTLAIVSKTGTATTEFTIQAPPATGGNTQTPPTGDGHHTALWMVLLATCGVLLSAGLWYATRRKSTKHQ